MSQNNLDQQKNISRRKALKYIGLGVIGAAGAFGIVKSGLFTNVKKEAENGTLKMATRLDKGANTNISLLGFGCMRFPTYEVENADGKKEKLIDMAKSEKLVDYAYAHGINYYDTAYNYHKTKSGAAIGTLLKKYPRQSFYLANKMPTWLVTDNAKAKELFQEQLDKCQVEYFDYYLLHSLGDQESYDKVYEEYGVYQYLLEEKAKGRIKRLGFSFHGDNALFDYLLAKHNWDFVQLQINYIDWVEQDAKYLYGELEKRNIPCIIMEPLKGGMLASLNADADAILKEIEPDNTIASWAFRYAGSLPGVITVLSGMTEMEHLVDNVKTFSNFKPLSDSDRTALAKAIEAFLKFKQIGCTACKYCMPCKYGVDIPAVFAAYNKCVTDSNIPDMAGPRDASFNRKKRAFIATYNNMVPNGSRAEKCISCGKCATICPQKLDIPGEMKRIKEMVAELEK
ncbi:MAG: aldo/keto reductase [Bacteroidales bacterium]